MDITFKKSLAFLTMLLVVGLVVYHTAFAGGISAPVINFASGTYSGGILIKITDATAGTTIMYTTDGSVPTDTHGTEYTAPFGINYNTGLRAVACSGTNCSLPTNRQYQFASSHAGGGGTSNPADLPGGHAPTCDEDPAYCPPEAPKNGIFTIPLQAPAQGNVLSNGDSPFYRSLTVGSRGSDVYSLQQFLYSGAFLKTAPTGYFGSVTKEAVSAFQKKASLFPSTGFVGSLTISKINSMLGLLSRNQNGGASTQRNNCTPGVSVYFPGGGCLGCFYSSGGWFAFPGTTTTSSSGDVSCALITVGNGSGTGASSGQTQ